MAQRQAVETTGHNVANANTPGYSRQEVALVARTPFPPPFARWRVEMGQIGTGVDMAGVRRMHDQFLDLQVRQQLQRLGGYESVANTLSRLEDVLLEPNDNGLGDLLNQFWNAWDELGNAPTSSAARANLISSAQTVASRFQQLFGQLDTLKGELLSQADTLAVKVNTLSTRIADLNGQIATVEQAGNNANDLRDQRDLLLDELSKSVSYESFEDGRGAVSVYVGGSALVSADHANAIKMDGGSLVWSETGNAVTLRGGELKAILGLVSDDGNPLDDTADGAVTRQLNALNKLAQGIADGVNGLHQTGFALDGTTTGLDFFTFADPADPAKYIAVNEDLVAHPESLAASQGGSSGDGANAQAIAALRHETIASLGGATANGFYEGMIVGLGVESQQASALVANQQIVVDHLEQQRESFSGVSLDEEATNLVRFQNAYAAAAQFMSVVDDMLDRLINVVGAAGQ